MSLLNIKILAPEGIFWETKADEVILPGSSGYIGILNGHAPLITGLDVGILRVRVEGKWIALVVLGGFAEVLRNNIVNIVVSAVEMATSIDLAKAEAAEKTARELAAKAVTPVEKLQTTKDLFKARVRNVAARFAANANP